MVESLSCFVINLDRATERIQRFNSSAEQNGWQVERFVAVDQRDLAVDGECYRSTRDPSVHISLSPIEHRPQWDVSLGEVACTLSHMKLWRHIIDTGLPYACVFEDDVVFLRNRRELLPWPDDADVVFIHDLFCGVVPNDINPDDPVAMEHFFKQSPYVPFKRGLEACGYIITNKAAHRCLRLMQPCFAQIDIMLVAYSHVPVLADIKWCRQRLFNETINTYAAVQPFVTQKDEGFSYIWNGPRPWKVAPKSD